MTITVGARRVVKMRSKSFFKVLEFDLILLRLFKSVFALDDVWGPDMGPERGIIPPAEPGGLLTSGTRLTLPVSYFVTDHFRHNTIDTVIIHKIRNTAAPPKIKYVVSVSATKADGGPSMLMEHFSPKPGKQYLLKFIKLTIKIF